VIVHISHLKSSLLFVPQATLPMNVFCASHIINGHLFAESRDSCHDSETPADTYADYSMPLQRFYKSDL